MKLIKVSSKEVKCVLTREDLEYYKIGIEDFIQKDPQKTSELIHEIIDRAETECGFETSPEIAVQIVGAQDGELVLYITSGDAKNQLKRILGQFAKSGFLSPDEAKKVGQEFFNALGNGDLPLEKLGPGLFGYNGGVMENTMKADQERERARNQARDQAGNQRAGLNKPDSDKAFSSKAGSKKALDPDRIMKNIESYMRNVEKNGPYSVICTFKTYQDFEDFACACGKTYGILNVLFKMDNADGYYLLMTRGRAKLAKMLAITNTALEYGDVELSSKHLLYSIREHGHEVMGDGAINKVRKYCGL